MKLFLYLILLVNSLGVTGQTVQKSQAIEIGKRCPKFIIERLGDLIPSNYVLSGNKDRLLILDFWASSCTSCIESFPKLNLLQDEFKSQIQIILIGKQDRYIKNLYSKYKKHYNLHLVSVFDSILFKKYKIETVPHIIIIDDKKIVRAVTISSELNKNNITALLSRMDLKLIEKDKKTKLDFDKPFFINNNGEKNVNILFRSTLSDWNFSVPQVTCDFGNRWNWSLYLKNGIQESGIPLATLYEVAYSGAIDFFPGDSLCYGIFYKNPVLNIQDSSVFKYDFTSGKNIFCYSLIVPMNKANNVDLKEIMQWDLHSIFGYNVRIENKPMPCWKLIANKYASEMLLSKGGPTVDPSQASLTSGGFNFKNVPIKRLISNIFMYHQDEPPFIDETGIQNNIDISLNAVMTDLDDIRKCLKLNGLELIKSEKIMKVIVISDSDY